VNPDAHFWLTLDQLIAASAVTVDRPKGSAHPRYPDLIYPVDYGYLANTQAMDGGGLDVWVGSLPGRPLTAVVCTVDRLKRDAEIKLLLGCTAEEQRAILKVHNSEYQAGLLIERAQGPAATDAKG
jgi:inorganic pyrophosphatase